MDQQVQAELDYTLTLIRAILASKKGAVNVAEVEKDFFESEGSYINFKKFGCNSLAQFFEYLPKDKFNIRKEANGQMLIGCVIDASMSNLCKLVKGQKSKKKKSASKKKLSPAKRSYGAGYGQSSGFGSSGMTKSTSFYSNKKAKLYIGFENKYPSNQYKPFTNNKNFNNYPTNNFNSSQPKQHQISNQPQSLSSSSSSLAQSRTSLGQMSLTKNISQPQNLTRFQINKPTTARKSYNELIRDVTSLKISQNSQSITSSREFLNKPGSMYSSTNSLTNRTQTNQLSIKNLRTESENSLNEDDLWIVNAPYFLKEHQVMVMHIEDLSKVFVRLIGPEFSGAYEKMLIEMNSFYKLNSKLYNLKNNIETKMICVVYDTLSETYLRAQVKSFNKNQNIAVCFCVDTGKTEQFNLDHLYDIHEGFLKPKFQIIQVDLENLSCMDPKNQFLISEAKRFLENKILLAKRTQSSPLSISLFKKCNESFNEMFIKRFEIYKAFKLNKDEIFKSKITFYDRNFRLIYLSSPQNEKYSELQAQMNTFYNEFFNEEYFKHTHRFKHSNSLNLEQLNTPAYLNSLKVYCIKHGGINWRRVKILRFNTQEEALVQLIDVGNKDIVILNDIFVIDNTLAEFESLPPQVISVLATQETSNKYNLDQLINTQIKAKVIRLTSNVPTIEILASKLVKEPTSEVIQVKKSNYNEEESTIGLEKNEQVLGIDAIWNIAFNDLPGSDLPVGSKIFVSKARNPLDFVINLENSRGDYQKLMQEMKKFYHAKSDKYNVKAKDLTKGNVYVHKDKSHNCKRVKFLKCFDDCEIISENCDISVYDIDTGDYDAVKAKEMYYLTRRFLKLKRFAIKAQLAGVTFNESDNTWSWQSKAYFTKMASNEKSFRANIIKFDFLNDTFKLELIDEEKNEKLATSLVKAGHAKLVEI